MVNCPITWEWGRYARPTECVVNVCPSQCFLLLQMMQCKRVLSVLIAAFANGQTIDAILNVESRYVSSTSVPPQLGFFQALFKSECWKQQWQIVQCHVRIIMYIVLPFESVRYLTLVGCWNYIIVQCRHCRPQIVKHAKRAADKQQHGRLSLHTASDCLAETVPRPAWINH